MVVAKRNNNKSIEEKEATTGLGTRISLTLPSLLFEGFTTQSDFMLQDVNLKKDKEQEDAFDSVPSGRTKLEWLMGYCWVSVDWLRASVSLVFKWILLYFY